MTDTSSSALSAQPSGFRFDNSWLRELAGTYVEQAPDKAPAPSLVVLNEALAQALGLDPVELGKHPDWFAGGALPEGARSIALAYAGHQFGGFSAQLGDGRAHLLGEHLGPDGRRWDLQLKGSGRTPFSRGGDGKAVLGPMLREYLISEAMAALGVPTTRSLAVALTGEDVWRDRERQPGAVVARVASSHLRVGSFQFWAARGDTDQLARLADYAIRRHDPDLIDQEGRVLAFLDRVIARQVTLVAQWMGLGFVHGVMNTDNMSISGETIDYGPCAFMEGYAPGTVFSSIDHQGRYAYANQPLILGWNLARLAEALVPIIPGARDEVVADLNHRLAEIAPRYEKQWLGVMRRKLGLLGAEDGDRALVDALLSAMQGVDWTLAFRRLADAAEGDLAPLRAVFGDAPLPSAQWFDQWRERRAKEAATMMRMANPVVIPRNHLVETALSTATKGDLRPFLLLLSEVTEPFIEGEGRDIYALPAPSGFGDYVTFCGT